ncbi:dienelactone hydrolase family protein [Methylocystis sp. SC2]|uniref:dienelactone hydrolase family protein n=1 Tax=Methylocystis sp. (strain SC2) TaxID=187303 RepID=UPI00027AF0DF|nr:dienelactone hydrolase family protein [Methylocystis sp. SC2]CCJ06489.1 carboxymethylenebutenolidase (Dienelactonehydrolase) [Methylocystis sp. SC2]
MPSSSTDPGRFAQAAGAPAPSAIATDVEGLEAGMATLPGGAPAYIARPQSGGDFPIILVAQEIFGLHEHIRDIVRRFAKLGFLAIAPDFLIRYGDPQEAPDIEAIRAIVARVPDAETMEIFDQALAYAVARGGDAKRAAITGFCWGGRIAWLYAVHHPRLRACIPWYGRLDGPHTPEQPRWPIDVAAQLKTPTLALYGGADPSIPTELIETMRERLKKAQAPAEIIVYDGAPHAFFADYRDSYRLDAASDAWERALAFLRVKGVE